MLMLGADYSAAFSEIGQAQVQPLFMEKLKVAARKIADIRNSKKPGQYTAADMDACKAQANDMVEFFNQALTHYGSLSWYDQGMLNIETLKKAADYVTGQALAYQMAPKTVPMPTGAGAGGSTGTGGTDDKKPNYLLYAGIAAGAVALYFTMR